MSIQFLEENYMKIISIAAVTIAMLAAPAFAEKPEAPGQGGKRIANSTQFYQERGTPLGQVVSEQVHERDFSLGDWVKITGSYPESANND